MLQIVTIYLICMSMEHSIKSVELSVPNALFPLFIFLNLTTFVILQE